jgi:hypothetical protein
MTTFLQKALITTLLASGMSAIALAPAHANGIKNVSIGGTAATDYLLYDANATETFVNPSATLQSILSGDKNSPTGNIELAASSEKAGFDFSKATTLNGTIGGRSIAISSMTASDWNSSYKGTTTTFGEAWFNQAISSNGFAAKSATFTSLFGTSLFSIFKDNGGFQRFSDPNISYVNQNTAGDISIGLAGHYNANVLLMQSVDQYISNNKSLSNNRKFLLNGLKTQLSTAKIQASEVLKYEYNGLTDYAFSFEATESKLTERGDKLSHTGNYEVVIKGPEAIKHVPEPGVLLSLAGISGVAAMKRRRKAQSAV